MSIWARNIHNSNLNLIYKNNIDSIDNNDSNNNNINHDNAGIKGKAYGEQL